MRLDHGARIVSAGVRLGFFLSMRYFFKPKPTLNYPFEKGPISRASAASMRCAAIRTARTLHRLQAVRGDLPGPGDHHRGRPAPQRRHAPHHALRHRHGEVHLLRLCQEACPSTLSWKPELRVRDRNARRALLRQGAPARERRPWEREIAKNMELDAPYR